MARALVGSSSRSLAVVARGGRPWQALGRPLNRGELNACKNRPGHHDKAPDDGPATHRSASTSIQLSARELLHHRDLNADVASDQDRSLPANWARVAAPSIFAFNRHRLTAAAPTWSNGWTEAPLDCQEPMLQPRATHEGDSPTARPPGDSTAGSNMQ